MQVQVLDCDKNLNLQNYLNKAAKRGRTEKDKQWLVRCAKLLITFWGEGEDCATLHDYAAREYGDMLRCFYKPRWEKFINEARKALQEGREPSRYNRYQYDKVFLEDGQEYSVKVRKDLFEVAKIALSNI